MIVGETRTALVRRARRINKVLAETYPDARCELDFGTPLQLLVATILSAQSTDRRVNTVTPALFETYPDAAGLAAATVTDVEQIIRPTGFFHVKAQTLVNLGIALCTNFGGNVPGTLAELVTLPGVGRKTANVVLGNAFGVPGITPDTHFIRLTNRFGWVDAKNPDVVEHTVGELFPRKDWTQLCHNVIWHGRRRCHAQRPACGACPVARWCPAFGAGPVDPEHAAKRVLEPRR